MEMRLLSTIKSKLTAIIAIALVMCFGFAALGCFKKFETESEYLTRVAKNEWGLKEILWVALALRGNSVTGIDYYTPKGNVRREDPFISSGYAYYVLGINKYGYETFLLVPNSNDTKVKAREYQWPFAYSFTEIAGFAAEHGYKYVDKIDDCLEEYLLDETGALQARDKKYDKYSPESRCIDVFIELFEDPDKKYDELDVKFVFYFAMQVEETWRSYFIAQEGGKLLLYEAIETDTETNINVIASYDRNKQDAETVDS